MDNQITVFAVGDDEVELNCLGRLIESVNLKVQTFPSAEEFLASYDPAHPGCVVVDMRMPGMSGLDIQRELASRDWFIPIIFVTGFASASLAVRAMKAGAFDFLEKPVDDQTLLDSIRAAIAEDARIRKRQLRTVEIRIRLARLTPREREVLELVVVGQANKAVAKKLAVSEKTVEIHRSHVMKKLQAETIAELVRMVMAVEAQDMKEPGDRGPSGHP